jgi:hypothetical protein
VTARKQTRPREVPREMQEALERLGADNRKLRLQSLAQQREADNLRTAALSLVVIAKELTFVLERIVAPVPRDGGGA